MYAVAAAEAGIIFTEQVSSLKGIINGIKPNVVILLSASSF